MVRTMTPHSSRGFTFIELLVVIVLAGIIMGFAVYGMRDLLANQRMKTAAFNLVVSSMFARSEAVKQGVPVTIKAPSADDLTNGWCVLISSTASCDLSSPDVANTIRLEQPVGGVTYAFITTAGPITFNRAGRLSGLVKIEITDNQDASLKRCITIDAGGNAISALGACS